MVVHARKYEAWQIACLGVLRVALMKAEPVAAQELRECIWPDLQES